MHATGLRSSFVADGGPSPRQAKMLDIRAFPPIGSVGLEASK